MYPTELQYRESVENKKFPPNSEDYKLEPILKDNEEVILFSGGRAVVFKVIDLNSNTHRALKFFTLDEEARFKRYTDISVFLSQLSSSYFVDFKVIEKLIYVELDKSNIELNYFPGLMMNWANGMTFGAKLEELCTAKNSKKLKKLRKNFLKLALFLVDSLISHGDIKHDNILVADDLSLVLVDYDGIFVPSFTGQQSTEMGTSSFQHPKRSEKDFNARVDEFSLLSIYISLLALESNPELLSKYNDQQNILFTLQDFIAPNQSKLFDELVQNKDIVNYVYILKKSLENDYIYIDNIKDILNGIFPKPEVVISHSPEIIFIGDSVDLRWDSKNVDYLFINDIEYPLVGSHNFTVVGNDSFEFKIGNFYSETKCVYLLDTLNVPIINSFSANNVYLKFDEKLKLEWNASHFDKVYLKYNDVVEDVTTRKEFNIGILTKDTCFTLELVSSFERIRTKKDLRIKIVNPISLQVNQEKKITFRNRPVKIWLQCSNADTVTLQPLNIDLTGKNEYEIFPLEDTKYTIVAENKRYKVVYQSEIEVLKPPTYTKDIVKLPNISLTLPPIHFSRFPLSDIGFILNKNNKTSSNLIKGTRKFDLIKTSLKNIRIKWKK
jgi:hypothetical protein